MIITGWSDPTLYAKPEPGSPGIVGHQSSLATWILIVTQWLTFLLYLWSLIAPSVLKNRDFS